MPGFLLHANAVVMCPHGAPATIIPSQPRVLVSGQPVATIASPTVIAGCPFVPVKPQPCTNVQWIVPATRVLVGGQPALVTTPGPGPGICLSAGIPNGPPIIVSVQPRVIGT